MADLTWRQRRAAAHPLPKKQDRDTNGSVKISVRLPKKLHAQASRAAQREKKYLMDWVRELIEARLAA